MLAHVLRRALRSLWENLSLNLVSTGVIAAALMLAGTYLTVMVNLGQIVDTWDRDVHVSLYFFPDVPVDRRFALKDEIEAMPQVAEVRYVSEAEARAWMEERVPEVTPALAELGDEVLPSSLELTLVERATHPAELAAVIAELQRPDFEDVDYGQEWVRRFDTFLSLLELLGVVLGTLIVTAAIFLVGNTMHLVAHARRAELETMKLVGATWGFVAAPFVLEGAIQGLIAGGLTVGGLWAIHNLLVVRLQAAFQLALGTQMLHPLPGQMQALLVLVGVVLGTVGCLTAIRRFWTAAP